MKAFKISSFIVAIVSTIVLALDIMFWNSLKGHDWIYDTEEDWES